MRIKTRVSFYIMHRETQDGKIYALDQNKWLVAVWHNFHYEAADCTVLCSEVRSLVRREFLLASSHKHHLAVWLRLLLYFLWMDYF